MIQIIDSYLKPRAGGRARVRSDAHISTGHVEALAARLARPAPGARPRGDPTWW